MKMVIIFFNIFLYICKDEIVRIYKSYHVLNADIHTIGNFLEEKPEIVTRKVIKNIYDARMVEYEIRSKEYWEN